VTYIPIPVVLLTEVDGTQNVYIAPEAFNVTSAEFGEEIEFWQNALPGTLKGKLSLVSLSKSSLNCFTSFIYSYLEPKSSLLMIKTRSLLCIIML